MVVEFTSLRLSAHAKEKMRTRDIGPEELAEVLTKPQIVEPSAGRLRMVRDDLCAVVATDTEGNATVVTILLRQLDQWTDDDMVNREGAVA